MEFTGTGSGDEACPGADELDAFTRGEIADAALDTIASHLTRCDGCLAVVADLQSRRDGRAVEARLRDGSAAPSEAVAGGQTTASAAPNFGGSGRHQIDATGGTTTAAIPGQIGPYRVLGVLGAGGMGVVYHARHQVLHREAAVKTIKAGAHFDAGVRERFRTEGQAVARLRHPSIVELFDFAEHDGQPYIAMELVAGESLAGRLRRGPMGSRQAAELVRTLAGAVAAAHGGGVLHRDLKPSNVLFTADGTPKVADFGLARLLDDPDGGLTPTEAFLGTPAYMAPEQAAGRAAEVNKPADVWALGAILYECLTGRPPYHGKTKFETLRLASEGRPVPPSVLRQDLPRDLEAVCLKAMARDPAGRYGSAQALADDLGRWLAADPREPTVARPVGAFGRLGAAVRLRARDAGVRLLAVACGILGLVALYPGVPAGGISSAEEMTAAREDLEATLVAAKPRQAVELLRAPGTRTYYRVRYGDDLTKVSFAEDGTLLVSSWAECLVELVPDPRHDSYQFRARVRHQASEFGGRVGLYFSHRTCPSPGGKENHWFGRMTYNDVRRPQEDVNAAALPQARGRLQAPFEGKSRVSIGLGARGDRATGLAWGEAVALRSGAPFAPRGIAADTWRDLLLSVTPAGVEGTMGGQAVGYVSADDLTKAARKMRDDAAAYRPHPAWDGCDPDFNSRGGLGLIVYHGTASFQAVELTIPNRDP
jgi:hypothetical protein